MPWVIKSIISSLSGFRRLFSRLGLDLLTSQSGTRLIRDKFFVQETSSPPTVIKGKCSLEKEPALQILLHSPSRGWLTAQLAFFADEQLFPVYKCCDLWGWAVCAGLSRQRGVGVQDGPGLQGVKAVLCFAVSWFLCTMFSKWIFLSVRSNPLLGSLCICKNHPGISKCLLPSCCVLTKIWSIEICHVGKLGCTVSSSA